MRFDDNRNNNYGEGNNDRGVFGNKGGYGSYRSMENTNTNYSQTNDDFGNNGATIDWGALNKAAVSKKTYCLFKKLKFY